MLKLKKYINFFFQYILKYIFLKKNPALSIRHTRTNKKVQSQSVHGFSNFNFKNPNEI